MGHLKKDAIARTLNARKSIANATNKEGYATLKYASARIARTMTQQSSRLLKSSATNILSETTLIKACVRELSNVRFNYH